jgi:hypothetical protein
MGDHFATLGIVRGSDGEDGNSLAEFWAALKPAFRDLRCPTRRLVGLKVGFYIAHFRGPDGTWVIMEDHAQQRAVHFKMSIVFDET